MTARERWLAVLNREEPDRLPMDYWATDEATEKVLEHLGCADEEELFEQLHIDRPLEVEPAYVGPPIAWGEARWPTEGYDMHGCRFEVVTYGTGAYSECVEHPLSDYKSVEEVEANYTWPTADWFDFSVIGDQVKGKDDLPVRGGGSEPFLIYANLRGMERAYLDLVSNPDLVHYCLDRLFDFCYHYSLRIYETIPDRVDISYVAEDFGSQENLLFSPEHIRTFFIPRMERMIDLAHEAGVHVFTHSDGAIRPIIPDLIEAGIDVLNPIQWRCRGMDREGLKRDFGDQVIFHGGVDNQQTLAFGSVDDVRQEVLDNVRILGAGGGYILAPCHNIQAVSPPENVVAMYETGYRHG